MNRALITGVLLTMSVVSVLAAESGKQVALYVSPNGSDAFAGMTKEESVASLARARDLARSYAGKSVVTVHVADGVYYLPETLTLSSEDSGSAEHPIVYRAEHEGCRRKVWMTAATQTNNWR